MWVHGARIHGGEVGCQGGVYGDRVWEEIWGVQGVVGCPPLPGPGAHLRPAHQVDGVWESAAGPAKVVSEDVKAAGS